MADTYLAQHEVSNDDTLSALALKYYGSATKEMWMLIYEANKDIIGPNPNILRPGILLKIPAKTALTGAVPPQADHPEATPRGAQSGKGRIDEI